MELGGGEARRHSCKTRPSLDSRASSDPSAVGAERRRVGSEERKAIMAANPLKGKCATAIDAEPGARRTRRPAATMIS